MKKTFRGKLALKKQTIANLDRKTMSYIHGGLADEDSSGPLTCSCPSEEPSCPNSCILTLCNVEVTETGCPPTR